MKRKIISLLLCLVMALSLIPTVAFGYSKSDAEQRYERVDSFDHIDVRVNATFTYKIMTDGALTDTVTKTATISNPKITLYDKDDKLKDEKSFSTSTKYEWRWTRITVSKTDKIAVTCDITVDGQTMRGKTFTFAGKDDFVQAILNCDGHQGLDFNISGSDVHNILSDGKLTIVKNLNQTFDTDQTFTFNVVKVVDGNDETFTDTITVPVPAGATTAQVTTDAKYAYGTYTVTEANATIDGYNWTAPAAQRFTIDATHLDESLTFINTYEEIAPATTSVTVTKVWNDDGVPEKMRPESVKVNLMNGDTVVDTATLNAGNNWQHTFENLSVKDANDKDINYTVEEVAVPGYTPAVTDSAAEGFTITNTADWDSDQVNPASLTITKVDSKDNKPLSGAEFTLRNADGTPVGGKALVTNENGTCTFTDLTVGTYMLEETKAPEGYEKSNQIWTIMVQKDEDKGPDIVLNSETNKFQKVYDCTVSERVENEDKGEAEYVPLTNGLTVTNEKITGKLIIEKTVSGAKLNADKTFTFTITNTDTKEKTEVRVTVAKGSLKNGNYVGTGEVELAYGKYTVAENVTGTGITGYNTLKTTYSVNNSTQNTPVTVDVQGEKTNVKVTNTYSNKHTPAPKPTTPTTVTSVKTGDMGVALYAGLAILSMTGSAGVILRRRKNDK